MPAPFNLLLLFSICRIVYVHVHVATCSMFLDHCTERCGWISAIIAAIAFGSFGVPIKQTKNINVDPLVMQVSSFLFIEVLALI